ncbi:hypothetical protein TrCOL_g7484 [Triparma columacea]|uniref:Uncharacterized protein n=1 Tax=Triparma columacea TaxID=722753 RepID=A0A9W7G2B1_9STRA|nr:hypothetical protein TrCOL_g7484 [Triparma columacea]
MSKLFSSKTKANKSQSLTSAPSSSLLPSEPIPSYVSNTTSSLKTFQDLSLPTPLITTLSKLGITKPTQIQISSIPPALSGHNILGISSTGSGKTLAFALPILTKLQLDPYGVFAVVVSPTRELAKQIDEQINLVGATYSVSTALITGGGDMVKQALSLSSKPHFVVGTPGRIRALLDNDGQVNFKGVRFFVLDEADRILSSRLANGLLKDCVAIAEKCRVGRRCQVLAFSATGGKGVKEGLDSISGGEGGFVEVLVGGGKKAEDRESKVGQQQEEGSSSDSDSDSDDGSSSSAALEVAKASQTSPSSPSLTPTAAIPAGLKQQYIFMPHAMRDMYLVACVRHLMKEGGVRKEDVDGEFSGSGWTLPKRGGEEDEDLTKGGARSAVVFVGTCERAAHMEGTFRELGIDAVALHSLLTQDRRNAALGKFKSQQVRVLIATDIASRGLDIPTVDLVINSELPRKARDYIHRVGRTARAGRRGLAVTLVGEEDVGLVHAAEKLAGREMEKNEDIKDRDVLKLMSSVAKASRLTKVKLDEVGFGKLVKKRKGRKEKERKARQKVLRQAGLK